MNDKNDIYKPELISLFTINFEDIKNRFDNTKYNWDNFSKIFMSIYKLILNSDDELIFLKNYYLLSISYINYTNYLKFISHRDYENLDIYKFINNLKYEKKIIQKIINYSSNKNIRRIIKIYNPFFSIKTKKVKNDEYSLKFLKDYIQNTKQMEVISDMSNDNVKKILNIIIYRYVISNNNNYEKYDSFYKEKIATNNLDILLDFDNFIKQIPFSKNILSIKTKQGDFGINISLDEVIRFIITKFAKIQFIKENNNYILINKKYGGKINIKINSSNKSNSGVESNSNIELNYNQINYSLVHYGIEELHDLNFLKKTESNIEIKLSSNKIKDYTSLLDTIHIIITSLKILETYPTDLNECLYPIDYTNYYFLSFCIFFEYVKLSIDKNFGLKKFIIDLIKFLYIYSYYDYYFYYSTNLMETIISSYNFKNEIFNDFISNLKNTLKLPKELLSFPPFFNINDDINSVVYYNFEIPSYYKFFDLINAICYVFDKNYYKNNKQTSIFNILEKHLNVVIENTNVNTNSNVKIDTSKRSSSKNKSNIKKNEISETSSSQSIDDKSESSELSKSYSLSSSTSSSIPNDLSDLKSMLDSDILTKMSKDEKTLMHNKNTYIELNVENSINCLFITDNK